jgi:hypothetical protein
MTPGQIALQEAVSLRMREVSAEKGVLMYPTDWVLMLAGQTMEDGETFYWRETRGAGNVPVHTELGLIEYARTRLKGSITRNMRHW